jgi:uncharacterized protein (TIGR00304 family)
MPTLRPLLLAAFASLAGGIGLVVEAVLRGQVSGAVVVVFPVFYSSSGLFAAGVALIFLAIVLAAFSSVSADSRSERSLPATTETGGFVLLGPVPIVFGSVHPPVRWLVVLGAVLSAVIVALALWAWFG